MTEQLAKAFENEKKAHKDFLDKKGSWEDYCKAAKERYAIEDEEYRKSPNAKKLIKGDEIHKLEIGEWFAVRVIDTIREMQKVNKEIVMWQRPSDGRFFLCRIYENCITIYGNVEGYASRPDYVISKELK